MNHRLFMIPLLVALVGCASNQIRIESGFKPVETKLLQNYHDNSLVGIVNVSLSAESKKDSDIYILGPRQTNGTTGAKRNVGRLSPGGRFNIFLPPGGYLIVSAGDSNADKAEYAELELEGGSSHNLHISSVGQKPKITKEPVSGIATIGSGTIFEQPEVLKYSDEYRNNSVPKFKAEIDRKSEGVALLRLVLSQPKKTKSLTVNGVERSASLNEGNPHIEIIERIEPGDNVFKIVAVNEGGLTYTTNVGFHRMKEAEIQNQANQSDENGFNAKAMNEVVKAKIKKAIGSVNVAEEKKPPVAGSSEKNNKQTLEEAKRKCDELGIKIGTERFGKCVLTISR
jgi:hypothetical protein